MRIRSLSCTATLLILAAACSDAGPLPLEPEPEKVSASDSNFLVCPVDTTRSVRRTIGILGGTIALDGHSITLPLGAVLRPTTFTLTVPESPYVEVEIHAEGHDSFQFLVPASITMSYDRCDRTDIDPSTLSVWHIDGLLRTLLEPMGGLVDEERRTIRFDSGHLSGFIIAN